MRFVSPRHFEIALAYLASYAALDWVSYVHPLITGFNITPWNPPTGLSFALVLLFGPKFVPWLFVAPLLGDTIVLGLPPSMPVEVASALIIGAGYGGPLTLLCLRRHS